MMIWLLKCLVIHLLNYQQLSLPYTLISSLGPTDIPNSVTPRWTTSAISQTLVNSDFPILNSVSPKHELPSFCNLLSSNRCHRDDEAGPTEIGKLLSLHESDSPRLYFRSHRKSQRSHDLNFRSHRVVNFGLTEIGQMCVTVGFCVEAIKDRKSVV